MRKWISIYFLLILCVFIFPQYCSSFWLFLWGSAWLISLGVVFWFFIHELTGARWDKLYERKMRKFAKMLPWLAIGGSVFLWPKVQSELLPWLQNSACWWDWKNPWCVDLRLILVLILTSVVSWAVGHRKVSSALGLIVFSLSLTVWATDWLMQGWFSSIWSVFIFSLCAQSGAAILALGKRICPLDRRRLLAMSIFGAYIAYSQYMLIWYANLPEETGFYSQLNSIFVLAGVALSYVIPFFILLLSQHKIRLAAASIVLGFFVNFYMIVF